MRIGYACQTIGIPGTDFKSCILRNADETNLKSIISHNLESLERILDYNIFSGIKLFRITSDLIPFGSSPVNKLEWWKLYEEKFDLLGDKIRQSNMRVSLHPGQYTVLNSPSEDVVKRAIEDLEYHTKILKALGMDKKNKLVLHIGGAYNDRQEAIQRFINNFKNLGEHLKDRLVLENDDRIFRIEEVLSIGQKVGAPVIFDNLHNKINPSSGNYDEIKWINLCQATWKQADGPQKIHYSDQHPNKKPGSHSDTIDGEIFKDFCQRLNREDIDIMLEVKDKNLSAVKCCNIVASTSSVNLLEKEWSRYKYLVLEKSPKDYNHIRQLLKMKEEYNAVGFYKYLDHAMEQEIITGNGLNAALHVWGYFKECADEKEKVAFEKRCSNYKAGKLSLNGLKKYLWQLSCKYQEEYLLNSYYFSEVM